VGLLRVLACCCGLDDVHSAGDFQGLARPRSDSEPFSSTAGRVFFLLIGAVGDL
jgi:hypothetical protein